MPHKRDAAAQIKCVAYIKNVLRIAVEVSSALGVKGSQVGFSRAHVVKQHLSVRTLKGWRDTVPHGLIAPEAMGVQKYRTTVAQAVDVVALNSVHWVLEK
jgi:hypothetical protein